MSMIRDDFPVFNSRKDLTYLDSAASSLKPKCVIDALNDYYINYSCNIERGVYQESLDATNRCEESRKKVAKFMNASDKEIIFTRGASNSLNMVSLMMKRILKEGDEVITTELEHHSSFLPLLDIKKEKGIEIKFVPLTEDGHITIENFKSVLSNKTKFVQITHVSNVLGYRTPIEEIIKLAHEVGAIVSVDGAQAIPHEKVDVKALDCDFYSYSLHKMAGPTGLGILYGKKKLLDSLDPVEFGGEMNDEVYKTSVTYKATPYKFETGTMPIAEMFACGAAIDYLESIGMDKIHEIGLTLRNKALEELKKIPEIEIYNASEESTVIAFNIKGIHSHDAVSYISERRVAIRAGHHCAEPLHRLLNLNATLRASFYFYNNDEDVKNFIKAVRETVDFFKEVGFIG